MSVKQISVFLENRPGALYAMTKVLEKEQIDLQDKSGAFFNSIFVSISANVESESSFEKTLEKSSRLW